MKKDLLTVEELIELAKTGKAPENLSPIDQEVQNFINDIGVIEAQDKTHSQNIYWVYRKWCLERDIVPLTNRPFFKNFGQRFKRYGGVHGTLAFWVKKDPFELSEDEWWTMKKFYRDSSAKRKARQTYASKKRKSKS